MIFLCVCDVKLYLPLRVPTPANCAAGFILSKASIASRQSSQHAFAVSPFANGSQETDTHTHTHSCSERRSNQHAYVTPHNPCCDAGLFAGRMKVMCPQEKQIVIVANTLNIRKMLDMISGLWPYLRRQRAAVDSLAWCDQVHALGRCASSCEEGTFWHHMRTGTQVLWCNQLQNPRYQHAGADPRLVCISFPLVCESASRGL